MAREEDLLFQLLDELDANVEQRGAHYPKLAELARRVRAVSLYVRHRLDQQVARDVSKLLEGEDVI
jgi:hypothetical protein